MRVSDYMLKWRTLQWVHPYALGIYTYILYIYTLAHVYKSKSEGIGRIFKWEVLCQIVPLQIKNGEEEEIEEEKRNFIRMEC